MSCADATSADEAVGLLTQEFATAAHRGAIRASAIFYHGHDSGETRVLPAEHEAEANCIVALLDHRGGQAVAAVIGYARNAEGRWVYAPASYVAKKPIIFGG